MLHIVKLIKEEKGAVAVLVAITVLALVGFVVISVDVGYLLTARNQLQSAVDAAALAGASALLTSQADATNRAIYFAGINTCMKKPVVLTMSDIKFPSMSKINVSSTIEVNLNFAPAIGIKKAKITALASAQVGKLMSYKDLKPWAIPDLNFKPGQVATLKTGEVGAPGANPSFFYAVDYPPVNRGVPETGAKVYKEKIVAGAGCEVAINDVLLVEPGNMVGPTSQGVKEVIAMDIDAYWDGKQVVSKFGDKSPRIVKIPFYDPKEPPDPGRKTIDIVGLGSFFLIGMNGKDVQGAFLNSVTTGKPAPGETNSMLFGVKLVE